MIEHVFGVFTPAAVSLWLSQFPLVALLSPSIPALYAMTASRRCEVGGGGGCRLPGSVRWGRSAPDESWLCTNESWLCTDESWLCTDESWLCTHESWLCTQESWLCTVLYIFSIKM